MMCSCYCRCGNVAAILELDENLQNDFLIFEAAPNVSDHFVLNFRSGQPHVKLFTVCLHTTCM